jgi:hypothetical protein
MSQGEGGNKEYIELLVVGEQKCSVVDLRSWIVDDNNGDFGVNGISRGYLKFTDDILWSRVMSGTTILLWNVEDTSTYLKINGLDIIDTDPNDFRIIIPVGCKNIGTANQQCPSSQYIVGVTNIPTTTNPSYNSPFVLIATTFRWVILNAFGNTADAVQTRKPDGTFFMGFAYGNNPLHPLKAQYDTLSLNFTPFGNTYQLTNQYSFDYNDKRNWSTGATKSPASPNSSDNEDYVLSIQVDNDCTLDIKYPVENNDNTVEINSNIVNTTYYNLLGQQVDLTHNYNKVIIRQDLYKNGDVLRKKIVIVQ